MLFKKRDYFPNNKTRIFKDKKIIIKIIIVLEIFINYKNLAHLVFNYSTKFFQME